MNVYWLEQTGADVPTEDQWLSARERLFLGRLRFPKRRTDWRLGRWTAKRAVAACLNLPSDLQALANTEIEAAASGAPEVVFVKQTPPVTISISHSGGRALCAVTMGDASLGCDLEMIEPRSDGFVADYFTAHEQTLVAQTSAAERPLLVTLMWSAKESVLKALHTGLRLDTTCLEVSSIEVLFSHNEPYRQDLPLVSTLALDRDRWCPMNVRYCNTQVFSGWWQYENHMVRTVVSDLPLGLPIHSTGLVAGEMVAND
jgi:4'-phosphopantetheinyl transferase